MYGNRIIELEYKEKVNIWSKGRVGKNINYETNLERWCWNFKKEDDWALPYKLYIQKIYIFIYVHLYFVFKAFR